MSQSPEAVRPAEHLPAARDKFAAFARAAHASNDGGLGAKTKVLVAVAAASALRDSRGSEVAIQKAREAGASEAEIAEALAIASGQGGGTQVFWMKDDLADLLGEGWRQDFVPDADRAFWDFKREVFESDVLPRQTKELIAVAVSCALRCRHCTRSHVEAALDAGASKKEVAETLAVLWAAGSEAQVAWTEDAQPVP